MSKASKLAWPAIAVLQRGDPALANFMNVFNSSSSFLSLLDNSNCENRRTIKENASWSSCQFREGLLDCKAHALRCASSSPSSSAWLLTLSRFNCSNGGSNGRIGTSDRRAGDGCKLRVDAIRAGHRGASIHDFLRHASHSRYAGNFTHFHN